MINPAYLGKEKKIRAAFRQEGIVILADILQQEAYQALQKAGGTLPFRKGYFPLQHSWSTATIEIPAEIRDYVSSILQQKFSYTSTAYCLTWKDYSILHDDVLETKGIDIVLDLSDDWNQRWGGVIIYDDGKKTIPLPSRGNSLVMVQRKTAMKRYMKYVNHLATGRKKVFILAALS